MSDIPDTNDQAVAMVAVAWEIAKTAYPKGASDARASHKPDERLKNLANAYIKAFTALVGNAPIAD